MNPSESTSEATKARSAERIRWGPVVGLFLLAPLVSEYLLGVMSIRLLPLLLVLGPIYGGGALLIRETVRRRQLGWSNLIVLALAFGIIEEGLVLQTLFRPDFMGLHLIAYGYIPVLGMGAWWTLYVLGIHTIWSIAVPIVLVESLVPRARALPWLRPRWLPVIAVLFVLGSAANFLLTRQPGSTASLVQLVVGGCVVVVLIAVAVLVKPQRQADLANATAAPGLLPVGTVAFVLGSAFMALLLAGVLLGGAIPGLSVSGGIRSDLPAPVVVAGQIATIAGGIALLRKVSGRAGWNASHQLAVATGLLLTYAWYGLVQVMLSDDSDAVAVVGQCLFVLGAAAMLVLAWKVRKKHASTLVAG
jgi:hypothetical protein